MAVIFAICVINWRFGDSGSAFNGRSVTYQWNNGSTIKFVNCWLDEGARNLGFVMYENPRSIEFKPLSERVPYTSYPPADDRVPYVSYPSTCVIPVFLAAKMLHKNSIDFDFMYDYLKYPFLVDTLLIFFLFYLLFSITLNIKHPNANLIVSFFLTMAWMFLPDNLLYLRFTYFSDEWVISFVFIYIILEIIAPKIKDKHRKIRYLYNSAKFLVALIGILSDYNFYFFLFACWLVRLFTVVYEEKGGLRKAVSASWIYVLPVIIGTGIFLWRSAPLMDLSYYFRFKFEEKTYGFPDDDKSPILMLLGNYLKSYTYAGFFLELALACLLIADAIRLFRQRRMPGRSYFPLLKIGAIILIPPVIHVLILMYHSGENQFAMMKFALPTIFSAVVLCYYFLHNANYRKFYFAVGAVSIAITLIINIIVINKEQERGIYKWVSNPALAYELEKFIKSHSEYENVYFSGTEQILPNPPISLAISNKRVYFIRYLHNISEFFPDLNKAANVRFVVRKSDSGKKKRMLLLEDSIRQRSDLLFESGKFEIYQLRSRSDLPEFVGRLN